jgi:hypothetical protein
MPEDINTQRHPNPELESLNKLVGTWKVSGAIEGTSRFEWAEGGFFLLHHFDFVQDGRRSKGLEIIGHEQKFGAEPSPQIKTRIYGFLDGITYDYVYEGHGDYIMIWLGEKGSAIRFDAKLNKNDNAYTGEWTSPNGGYKVHFTRIR